MMEDSDSEKFLEGFSLIEISPSQTNEVCKLCFLPAQTPESNIQLGPLYQYGVCCAHHFCLMFSSGLRQTGDDNEGIKGFLPDDIIKEWRRGSLLKCSFCKKKYATVGCIQKACRKCYHLPCGIQNRSLQQFFGGFYSYCEEHRPIQKPKEKHTLSESKAKKRKENLVSDYQCGVCLEDVDSKASDYSSLWAPCCGGRFHRDCIQQMGNTAGLHFFKCPLCNNTDQFKEEMLNFGIYLPDQDAEWETENNAFTDLLQRHDTCNAVDCVCPDGRKFDVEDTEWEIFLCKMCGSEGVHVKCGGLNIDRPRFRCSLCRNVAGQFPSVPVPVFSKVRRRQRPRNGSKKAAETPTGNSQQRKEPPQLDLNKLLDGVKFKLKSNAMTSDETNSNVSKVDTIQVFMKNVELEFDVASHRALEPPNPVQVRKPKVGDESSSSSDESSNQPDAEERCIPCPYGDCEAMLTRSEFEDHRKVHKKTPNLEESSSANQLEKTGDQDSGGNSNANEDDLSESDGDWIAERRASYVQSARQKKNRCKKMRTEGAYAKEEKKEDKSEVAIKNDTENDVSNRENGSQTPSKQRKQNVEEQAKAKEKLSKDSPSQPEGSDTSKSERESQNDSKSRHQTSILSFFKSSTSTIRTSSVSSSGSLIEAPTSCSTPQPRTNQSNVGSENKAKFVCRHCKISFTNMLSWKQHESSHSNKKSNDEENKAFVCTLCGNYQTSTERHLKLHITKKHFNVKTGVSEKKKKKETWVTKERNVSDNSDDSKRDTSTNSLLENSVNKEDDITAENKDDILKVKFVDDGAVRQFTKVFAEISNLPSPTRSSGSASRGLKRKAEDNLSDLEDEDEEDDEVSFNMTPKKLPASVQLLANEWEEEEEDLKIYP